MSETKSVQAKKMILRYLFDCQLNPGDRLPSYNALRGKLGFGTATIMAAVQKLQEEGVLTVRDKIGVYVRENSTAGRVARTVGLCASQLLSSPYYGSLGGILQTRLIEAGCRVVLFCCGENVGRNVFELSDFPGLEQAVRNKELNGLIHLDDFSEKSAMHLKKQGIPTLFVGATGISHNGLFLDLVSLVRKMIDYIPSGRRGDSVLILHPMLRKYCQDEFLGLGGGRVEDSTAANVDCLAEEWLAETDKMPSCLVLLDDLLALRLLCRLAVGIPQEKMPQVILLSNKQLMLKFPVLHPVVFEIDLLDVAAQALSIILEMLRENQLDYGPVFYQIPEPSKIV